VVRTNAGLFHLSRRDHRRAGRFYDLGIAADVIRVPVRVPDLGDAPASGLGLGQDARRLGGVDCGGFAALRIVRKEAVIVLEAGELVNLKHSGDWGVRD